MTFLAVIPARIGSKRIPRKNIKPLGGKPLIAYSVERAIASLRLDYTVVSTDSQEIISLVNDYGSANLEAVERDTELARDISSTEEVLLNVADFKGLSDQDAIVTLAPTSPFRSAGLIDRCIEVYTSGGVDSVLTVTKKKMRIGRVNDAGRFAYIEDYSPYMHQVSPLLYENSALYVTRVGSLRGNNNVIGKECLAIEIDAIEGHDINDPVDWHVAEMFLNRGLLPS
jgi:CMP-N,N'-diacetyllegionaminic acid synthase